MAQHSVTDAEAGDGRPDLDDVSGDVRAEHGRMAEPAVGEGPDGLDDPLEGVHRHGPAADDDLVLTGYGVGRWADPTGSPPRRAVPGLVHVAFLVDRPCLTTGRRLACSSGWCRQPPCASARRRRAAPVAAALLDALPPDVMATVTVPAFAATADLTIRLTGPGLAVGECGRLVRRAHWSDEQTSVDDAVLRDEAGVLVAVSRQTRRTTTTTW